MNLIGVEMNGMLDNPYDDHDQNDDNNPELANILRNHEHHDLIPDSPHGHHDMQWSKWDKIQLAKTRFCAPNTLQANLYLLLISVAFF